MGVHPNISRALACAAAIAVWGISPATTSAEISTATKTAEDRAIGAFLTYCLPAMTGDSVARVAKARKLKQLPAEEQDAILQGKPGTVYELPEVGRGAVLSAPDSPTCSVLLERVDAREFIEQATYWFGTDHSPFRLTANKTMVNGEIRREYRADIDGQSVVLRVTLRLQPVPGGAQAMLTGGRAE